MANLTGYAGIFPGGTSAVFTTPFPIKPGTKALDTDGNEYVFCSFGGPVSRGEWVAISDANDATAMLDTSVGRVGIVVGTGPTSNDGGWVQIYGLNSIAQTAAVTDAAVSAALALKAVTHATTPLGAVDIILEASNESAQIHNAWITQLSPASQGIAGATDVSWPTSATTDSSSPAGYQHTGRIIGVFLNYPYLDGNNVARLGGGAVSS